MPVKGNRQAQQQDQAYQQLKKMKLNHLKSMIWMRMMTLPMLMRSNARSKEQKTSWVR